MRAVLITRCLPALLIGAALSVTGTAGATPIVVSGVVSADAARATTPLPSDFDGDGDADLAVGARGEGVGARIFAGGVNVLPGSPAGPAAAGGQFWTQDSAGVAGASERYDGFGRALTSADFNGDGRADLAVGVPFEKYASMSEPGAVSVLYGSTAGLASRASQLWTQDSAGVPGTGEYGDRFGSTLAAGDFDADGYADLAVGVPSETIGTAIAGAGLVNILYGSPAGLRSARAQGWAQSSAGVRGTAENQDRFGAALAAGDVDGDGYADLAVGVPQENSTGAVQLLRGSRRGLTATGDQLWTQDSPGVLDDAQPSEFFGSAFALGDYNRDGRLDLAVGVPGEVLQACQECEAQGAVNILPGGAGGLTATGNAFVHIGSPGVPGEVWPSNQFGEALAAGDFDGDGDADLAVAAPVVTVSGQLGAGSVFLLNGGASGLTGSGLVLNQDTPGMPETAEPLDGFGMNLSANRFTGGTRDDLVIGFPIEDLGTRNSAGAVIFVPGSASGLNPTGSILWTQDSPGVRGTAEESDQFGVLAGGR
jgi:hypothetical protein